jgi:hypothetical protein
MDTILSSSSNIKYHNPTDIFHYTFLTQTVSVSQYSRIQIEQLRHDQVDGIFPVLKITLP